MSVHIFEEIRDEAERQGKVIDEQKKAEAKKPKPRKKKTAAEIMQQGMDEEAADARDMVKEIMEDARPKTPLEAAIDRATGFKPEDAVKAIVGTDSAETGTEKPDSETEKAETETEKAETETAEKTPAKRDWVKEAYECFVKDARDIDPTDPVKAVEAYFEKNATDELKARCKAEGKDAKGCWKFIEAVARKALHGSNGHIDPAVVYAIAMHWFEDVPKDWDKVERSSTIRTASQIRKEKAKAAKPKKPAETPSEIKKEKAKAKAAKKRKSKTQQGFFFEMLETPVEKPEAAASGTEQESEVQG
jgi:hypothetical protein